jgi:hypothetical protein
VALKMRVEDLRPIATGEASEIRNRGSYRGNGGGTHGTWTVRKKGSLSPWKRPRAESNDESARTSVGGFRWRMGPYYRGSRVMPVEGRGPDPYRARGWPRARRLTICLPTLTKTVQKLKTSLQTKAKAEPRYRAAQFADLPKRVTGPLRIRDEGWILPVRNFED